MPRSKAEERTRHLEHEMKVAALIQRRFLPPAPPVVSGLELGAYLKASDVIGGDFYDFIELTEDRVGIALGDASGKGIPGALLMAQTQGILSAEARMEQTVAGAVRQLNRLLCRHNAPDQFVTLFYAVLSTQTHELCYVNAGHPRALLCRPNGIERLPATGHPLGIFGDASFDECRVGVSVEDILLIYSDGVTEAQDPDDRFFDESGIERVLAQHRDQPADELARLVCHAAQGFERDDAEFPDDKTVVVVRFKEAGLRTG